MKLYNELAEWWSLLSPPEDYTEEAAFFWQILSAEGLPANPSLLELGCGGGSNAFHMKRNFARLTLTDLSPHMLTISRQLNPECEHLQGDMRTLRLGWEYDVVFIHDAIDYMTTRDDLRQALETASIHCKAGGLALIVPDFVRETFQPTTEHYGRDGEGRALRYLEWSFDPDPGDETYVVEMAYMMRVGDEPVRLDHERHVVGLFPRAVWVELLEQVGFQVKVVRDAYERDLFLARKPTR